MEYPIDNESIHRNSLDECCRALSQMPSLRGLLLIDSAAFKLLLFVVCRNDCSTARARIHKLP